MANAQSATQSNPVRILVADDHEVMRLGIRNLLESVPNWTVSDEAGTGREAVDLALQSSPDVIIMDIGLPGDDGIQAFRSLCFRSIFQRTSSPASRRGRFGERFQRVKQPAICWMLYARSLVAAPSSRRRLLRRAPRISPHRVVFRIPNCRNTEST